MLLRSRVTYSTKGASQAPLLPPLLIDTQFWCLALQGIPTLGSWGEPEDRSHVLRWPEKKERWAWVSRNGGAAVPALQVQLTHSVLSVSGVPHSDPTFVYIPRRSQVSLPRVTAQGHDNTTDCLVYAVPFILMTYTLCHWKPVRPTPLHPFKPCYLSFPLLATKPGPYW